MNLLARRVDAMSQSMSQLADRVAALEATSTKAATIAQEPIGVSNPVDLEEE
jgi:hypothetical protein